MTELMDKGTLLTKMREGYAAFEALLAPLSDEQMTTPTVNGNWSIKDNLAHLSFWHRHTLSRVEAVQKGVA